MLKGWELVRGDPVGERSMVLARDVVDDREILQGNAAAPFYDYLLRLRCPLATLLKVGLEPRTVLFRPFIEEFF